MAIVSVDGLVIFARFIYKYHLGCYPVSASMLQVKPPSLFIMFSGRFLKQLVGEGAVFVRATLLT
jgi:hypothetical protein